jgi:hypothetical protein
VTTPEAKLRADTLPQKSKAPSLRASARFAGAAASFGTPSLTKEEREAAEFANQAREERERVRALIQAVATESERVETELAEQVLGEKLQGIAEVDSDVPDLAMATALHNFNLMKDGDVIAEVRKGDTVMLVDEDPDKRWWRGYMQGSGAEDAGEFLQKFVQRSRRQLDDDGAAGLDRRSRRRRGGTVLGLEAQALEEQSTEEPVLPSLAELAGSGTMGIDSHLSALQALLQTDEPEAAPEAKAAVAFKRGLQSSADSEQTAGGARSAPDEMSDSITRAVEAQNPEPMLLSPSRDSDSGASSLSDEDRHAFESSYFNRTLTSMASSSASRRKNAPMTKYRERLNRMDEAQDDLRAEINDRLARLVGGAHSNSAAPPRENDPASLPAATTSAARRGMDSRPRSTRDSLAQMDTVADGRIVQESADSVTLSDLTETAASEALLAASEDAAAADGQRSRPTSGASTASAKSSSTGRGDRSVSSSERRQELATTATATGPLARLLARRSETAVDRLSSGKTTSHRRPGSATPLLNPAQLVEKRAREEEAVVAKEAERAAKEAKRLAKAQALAGDDSEEGKKKRAAKAAALAERAAPQEQPVLVEGPVPREKESSSSDGEEEGGDGQPAERGNITALMMTTSLTRRDRRVMGRDREPEPEAPATGRSSHSSSSSSTISKSSADSEAEEVRAKLDVVNERLARLGRK